MRIRESIACGCGLLSVCWQVGLLVHVKYEKSPLQGEVDPSVFVDVCKLLVASETSSFQFETLRINQSMAQELDGLSEIDKKIQVSASFLTSLLFVSDFCT